jgi:carboxypeptidase T
MTRRAAANAAHAAPERLIERVIVDLPWLAGPAGPVLLGLKTPVRPFLFPRGAVRVARSPIAGYPRFGASRHSDRMDHRVSRLAIGLAVAFSAAFSLVAAPSAAAADFPAYDSGYHNYAEMVAQIKATQAAHPDIVAIRSIGKSYQGRDIWVAKVSDNVAVDEPEPEVMFDSLHHAREHLSLEQNLALLRWLTAGYGTDPRITHIVDVREIWIVFAVNPDGAEYDLTGSPFRSWRKNRQPNPGSTAIGTDINRNYGYHWACCGGSSATKSSDTYHGSAAFSTPEARVIRDFIASRRIGGRQQIRTAITFHTAGEQILWPYGYTKTDVPADMTVDDHAALVALGQRMATTNGYTAKQSSSLYVTDGDEIDWAYGIEHIFMYTFELYPSHSLVSSDARFYPADELIGPQTERNKAAILMLIEAAACPYGLIGKATADCGPLFDDFETYGGWVRNQLGTDSATGGVWQRANPAPTTRQAGSTPSGSRALVTGYGAGANADANDVDGGVTTIRSSPVTLPAQVGSLTFRYYLAHSANSSVMDYLRAYVEDAAGKRTLVRQELGSMSTDLPAWSTATIPMAPWAGQTVRIVFAAADLGRASTVEAAVDDVRITRP